MMNRLSRLPAKILRLRFQHSRSTAAPFAERNHASETHRRRRARSSDGVRNHAARRDLVRTGPPHIGRRHCRACEALLRVSSVQVRRRVRACRESRSAVAVRGTARPLREHGRRGHDRLRERMQSLRPPKPQHRRARGTRRALKTSRIHRDSSSDRLNGEFWITWHRRFAGNSAAAPSRYDRISLPFPDWVISIRIQPCKAGPPPERRLYCLGHRGSPR